MNATANGSAKKLVVQAEVAEALRLFISAGGVAEVRVLEATTRSESWRPSTFSGYFDDPDLAAAALSELRTAKGIYFTLNELDPSILARAANRLRKSEKGDATGDKHVIRRRWLLIDLDAVRISGISATDAEVRQSIQRSEEIDLYLHDRGWPDSVICDSGNGRHLYYRIDLPADDGGLVERCLASLSKVFSDAAISIDTSVFNPSRITKLFGTLVCKGDSTPDRPHRFAKIVSVPDCLQVVSREQLEELAGPAPTVPPKSAANGHNHNGTAFDVAGFIARNNLDVTEPGPWEGGSRWEFRVSPMCEHGGDGPFIVQHASGAISSGCHHDSCRGRWGWSDLRARYEPKPERTFDGGDRYTTSPAPSAAAKNANTFAGVDAADLAAFVDEEVDWVVSNAFSADQTTLFGARSKATKTTQLAELGVALATCTDWLGVFTVPRARRTLFITGEANNRAISRRLDRACRARGATLDDLRGMLRVEALEFPQLPSAADREAVARTVAEHGIEVVIVDPLYRGLAGLDSARVTEIGGAIVEFAQACRPAALILSHHCNKSAAREYGKPPELEDMTGAGVAECCGNWWLIGRNSPYEFDGMHDLCVAFGGRDEQAGARRILFDERNWTFSAEPLHEYREAAADDAAAERRRAKDDSDQREADIASAKIKAVMANEKVPLAKTVVRDTCGATRKWFEVAFAALLRDGSIVTRPYRDAMKRVQPTGFLLREQAESYRFDPHSEGCRTVSDGLGNRPPP
jgi:hypothetical protein